MRPRRRIDALDGLRGLAVALVVLDHAQVPLFHGEPGSGSAGVTTFFVLSGFLITGLLIGERQRTGTIALGTFYLRRAARLLPALWVSVVVTSVLLVVLHRSPGGPVLANARPALFYYANFASIGHLLAYFDPTWSLAVEEHFYLVWPFVLLLIGGGARRRVVWVLLAVLTVVGVWWRFRIGDGPSVLADRTANRRTDAVAWALLLGGTLAALRSWRPRLSVRVPPLVTALVAVLGFVGVPAVLAATGHPLDLVGGPVLFGTIAAGLVVAAVGPGTGGWMAAGWLRWLGRRSYAVYLWQYPLIWLLPPAPFGLTGTSRLALASVATLLVAEVSWWVVEAPALKLGRRLQDRRSR